MRYGLQRRGRRQASALFERAEILRNEQLNEVGDSTERRGGVVVCTRLVLRMWWEGGVPHDMYSLVSHVAGAEGRVRRGGVRAAGEVHRAGTATHRLTDVARGQGHRRMAAYTCTCLHTVTQNHGVEYVKSIVLALPRTGAQTWHEVSV